MKSSRDWNPRLDATIQNKLRSAAWWTYEPKKIEMSQADFWVLVAPSFLEGKASFIVIQPTELLRRVRAIHGQTSKRIYSYLWVTRTDRCWEARGLRKADQESLASDGYADGTRDFTDCLNAWQQVAGKLT